MDRKHVHVLDLARIGLFVTIFFCHTQWLLPRVVASAINGLTTCVLEIFFMVSGFLAVLAYSSRECDNAWKFTVKKLRKFYPLHLICFLLCFLLQLLKGTLTNWPHILKTAAANLLLVQCWLPTMGTDYAYSFNGVTWFLSSITFCYFVTPFALRWIKKHKAHLLLALLLAIVLRYTFITLVADKANGYLLYFSKFFPPLRFLEYFCGMILGALYVSQDGSIKRSTPIQLGGCVLFFAAFFAQWMYKGNFLDLFIIVEFFLLYSLVFYDGILTDIAQWSVVKHLSSVGMVFFLIHQVFIKYASHYFEAVLLDIFYYGWLVVILYFGAILGLCSLYLLLEKKIKATCLRKQQLVHN